MVLLGCPAIRASSTWRSHSDKEASRAARAGDADGGKAASLSLQRVKKLEPGHVGHAHVGNQAAALNARKAGKKGRCRIVEAHRKARRAQQEGERLPYGLVVIDDMNDAVIRHRKRLPRSPIAR